MGSNLIHGLLSRGVVARIIDDDSRPSAARRVAMLRPMPRDAPVTTAIFALTFSSSQRFRRTTCHPSFLACKNCCGPYVPGNLYLIAAPFVLDIDFSLLSSP